jgi:hypothetical protein
LHLNSKKIAEWSTHKWALVGMGKTNSRLYDLLISEGVSDAQIAIYDAKLDSVSGHRFQKKPEKYNDEMK